MKTDAFLAGLETLGVDFFTGVPDSLLRPLNDTLRARYGLSGRHVVAADEGGAVALAAGHYIATGRPALVYLQNSGIGNLVNPVASLTDGLVYGIPCVLAVGWRGEPGVADEPQHAFQGRITRELLELIGLRVFELRKDTAPDDFMEYLAEAKPLLQNGRSVAFLMHKNALEGAPALPADARGGMSREEALRALLPALGERDVVVSTTGKTSREVFELREALGQSHARDFLTVGSMGHASMIALGIALGKPDRLVWCLDGDGAALMHMGALAVERHEAAPNLVHVVVNNGAHESVGGMPVAGGELRFSPIAEAIGFQCFTAEEPSEIAQLASTLRAFQARRPRFVEIVCRQGSRADLGRPTQSPAQNLAALMRELESGAEA